MPHITDADRGGAGPGKTTREGDDPVDHVTWIVGNWKMHGTREALGEALAIKRGAQMLNATPHGSGSGASAGDLVRFVICPPATLLRDMARCLDARPGDGRSCVALGGQDCHWAPEGPYTGDVSARMLADAGAEYVLIGHSERRSGHHENGPMIRAKGMAAAAAGLVPIFCVGENSRGEGFGDGFGSSARTISAQLGEVLPADPLRPLIIAYEPNWAIGTGMTPEGEEIVEMAALLRHAAIERSPVPPDQIVILYGGSVRPDNASAILGLAGVNGVLVGGASHSADKFLAIGAKAIAPAI